MRHSFLRWVYSFGPCSLRYYLFALICTKMRWKICHRQLFYLMYEKFCTGCVCVRQRSALRGIATDSVQSLVQQLYLCWEHYGRRWSKHLCNLVMAQLSKIRVMVTTSHKSSVCDAWIHQNRLERGGAGGLWCTNQIMREAVTDQGQ